MGRVVGGFSISYFDESVGNLFNEDLVLILVDEW